MRFFDSRLRQSFPGLSGISWFDGRMSTILIGRMLRSPLQKTVTDQNLPGRITYKPVWWTRGNADFNIDEVNMENGLLIINGYEFAIDRSAVYMGRTRYENFIYVETLPSMPTGLYNYSQEKYNDLLSDFGHVNEEYGYRPRDGKLITRKQYDDNGFITEDGVESADDFEVRIRYLSPFNFIITHSSSYLQTGKNTRNIVEDFLDKALIAKIDDSNIEDLVKKIALDNPAPRES